VVELSQNEQLLLSNWLFRGIQVGGDSGVRDLYQAALEMERRTRDHFRRLATDLPAGLEKDLCGELAAEEEEHVAMLETELEPRALLRALLAIEREYGRDRSAGIANGPRTLDLDILLFEDLIVSEPGLEIPHPRLAQRAFALTPLALVLLLIETTDLIFAVDSVPAVFSVTRKAFIVFTSNIFAIIGLRSMFFLLAGALGYFRYLKIGLSVVLAFVGLKMLLDPHDHPAQWFQIEIPTGVSLLVVAAILSISIALSVTAARRGKIKS